MDRDLLPRRSGRIVLRRLAVSDLAEFQAYRCDPEVARYQGWETVTDNEARSFLADVATGNLLAPGHWCQIAVALASTGELIGDIGLCLSEDEKEAELGVSLSRSAQGQGLAVEAVMEAIRLVFEHTVADRVVGITDIRNQPSTALLQRVGMRQYAQQESVVKGELCSELFFAITRDEVACSVISSNRRPR